VYPRKEAKQHGTGQLVEGVFEQGQRAVMVEDVITSGGSLLTTRDALQSVGLVADQAVVLVDREQGGVNALAEQGMQVYPVLKFSEILAVLHQEGKIDGATYKMVSEYLKG
jgi:uridine monophosphate synthetase